MSDLKSQLIKLGSTNPELRPHIRKILASDDEAILSFLRTDSGKKKAADAIYSNSPKDYKGKGEDGIRRVLYNEKGSTILAPVDGASPENLLKLLKANKKAMAKIQTLMGGNSKTSSMKVLPLWGGKTASGDILWSILDQKAYMRLYEEVDEMDEQSSKLLYEIMRKLQEALSLSSREEQAFNRLQGLLSRNMDIGNRRNQIFKIADLLGIKLPSAMF